MCNFYGSIINHKGCFPFTPIQNDSLIRPIEKWFLGVKGEILPPGNTDPKGTYPPRKHTFGCIERKSTLLGVSCGRVEGTKTNGLLNIGNRRLSRTWYETDS